MMLSERTLRHLGKKLSLEPELLEKDSLIHALLSRIAESDYLRSNLIFKGGTCLVKAYIPYYRFSEDIDFCWFDQSRWFGASARETERLCMAEMKQVIEVMSRICCSLDLRFNPSIKEGDDVFIGNSGTKLTLHLNYTSTASGDEGRVKMEINFLDLVLYSMETRRLHSLLDDIGEDDLSIHPEIEQCRMGTDLKCYSVREIFAEKIRAALTRKQYKIRDSLDMAMIRYVYGLDIFDFEYDAQKKIEFTTRRFGRYAANLMGPLLPESSQDLEKEMILMITQRPPNLMNDTVEINKHLNQLKNELSKKMKTI